MSLEEYLALFPGESREHPRFMAFAEAVLAQVMDLQALIADMQSGFSIAYAEGVQLDALAEALGLRRYDAGPNASDGDFRVYLLQKLALRRWDGTNEGVLAALPEGVTETDNQDGTVTVSPAGTNKELLPVPAGVRVSS